MTATDKMVWGLVAHLVADWPLQNDWMARHKAKPGHPAGIVHAAIHGLALAPVFRWKAFPLALTHYAIDLRVPVAKWSAFIRQTQPSGEGYDVGMEVRFWTDQVFHIASIAVLALSEKECGV